MGAPLGTCKQTSKPRMEKHVITQDQEIQKCAFFQNIYIGAVLDL
jgi:hypothetical protein